MVLKNGAHIVWYEVTYLSITFIHFVHLYGHKNEKTYIFFSFPSMANQTKEKEMHSSLFFSPFSPYVQTYIHKRIDFFFFSFSFPCYYSFLFFSLPSFVTKQSINYTTYLACVWDMINFFFLRERHDHLYWFLLYIYIYIYRERERERESHLMQVQYVLCNSFFQYKIMIKN